MSNTNTIQPFDAVIVKLEASNLIEASAGTGKTYSIALLTLRLILEKRIPIQEILMVTFTKAAVAELETRIRQFVRNGLKVSQGISIDDETITAIVQTSINKIGAGETETLLKEAVLFLDETAILTIHSFCQRILTEFAFETRQIFGAEILVDLKAVITDSVNAFWRKYITTLQVPLLQELIAAGLSRNNLVDIMKNALSGKKMIMLSPVPGDFLSEANQAELYAILAELAMQKETISNHIREYIVKNAEVIRQATEKNAYTEKNMLHVVSKPELLLEAIIDKRDKSNVQKVYPEIIWDLEKIEVIENEKQNRLNAILNHIDHLAIGIIAEETAEYKRKNNQLGFDDMITKLHEAVVVDNNEFLISSLQVKYKAAFIDEFQDTDKMQYEIFNRLFAASSVLFYIGDPKQSIYAWRKADIFTYFKAADEVVNRFGMNINYRSSKIFIEGMNYFFEPSPGFDSFSFSNEQNKIEYLPVAAPNESVKGALYKEQQPDVPFTIFENPNNETISETVVAQIILLLGSDKYMIEDKGIKRRIRPSDIGILVRKNKQATAIKTQLCKYCIPAVTIDDTKLFQTDEARQIFYLLEAVSDINSSSINKALLSPLTGFNAAEILVMDDELALSRFKEYQRIWESEGVYVMLAKFVADYQTKQLLLSDATRNGERVITNVLQLMELLHKTQTQKQFSPIELTNWLKRGIEGMEVEGDEFEQRVESDEEAVKIVTIHKSKGLEYNIVFAPFLDLLAGSDFDFITFRDEASGEYIFAGKSLLSAEQKELTAKQTDQENRRLIYVAVTRAVYKCYISRNTHHSFKQSGIVPFIEALKENPSQLVAFEDSPGLIENYRYLSNSHSLPPAYLQAEQFELTEVNWRKLSYTYLDGGQHLVTAKASANKRLAPYDEFIFKLLPRGANTGNLLHFIFERADFTNDHFWEGIITSALNRFIPHRGGEYSLNLETLLHQVSETNIPVGDISFQLNELHRDRILNELEFNFNVGLFEPAELNSLSTPAVPFQVRYAKELEGIMNGKIDMFFEHAGKYFILDWKSNFLGDKIDDYSPDNIQLAMTASNYHLQYLVYTIAVKKYLALHVPGFNYATHFGGVIYLFVRGIRVGGTEGIFAGKPEETLIDRLEELLSKNEHAEAG
ncbi:MAG: exodeoxyribonuclease V subunit beta [Ferruginibacter sp.]